MRFVPSPTGAAFMRSRKFIKLIMGPVGGGKSTVCLFDLINRAVEQRPFQGVRRTKFIILRNTMQQLMTTVKPLIDQWLITMVNGRLGEWRLTERVFELKMQLPDGTRVFCELCLMAADTPDDVRRLLSVEASGAWVEECREVVPEVFEGLQGRTMRFPSVAAGGITYSGVICSTNPPPMGTYWQELIAKPPPNMEVFIQPSALLDDGSINPEAENLQHLDPEYYANLVMGKTQDWIDVYLKNKFGPGGFGQPIYRSSFRSDFHIAKAPLIPIPSNGSPLVIGMDNGLQAAAVVMQQDARTRVNVLGECYVPFDQTMGAETFLDRLLVPYLNANFTVRRDNFLFVLDPACFQRSQVNEATIAQAVQTRGFRVMRASTNDPEKRIGAVEGLLTRAIDGQAGMLIDPRCKHLIEGLEWGYRHKKRTDQQATPQIEKNHHSHTCEAHQYGSLYFNAQYSQTFTAFGSRRREIKQRDYSYV
jgi:hypothetical protein